MLDACSSMSLPNLSRKAGASQYQQARRGHGWGEHGWGESEARERAQLGADGNSVLQPATDQRRDRLFQALCSHMSGCLEDQKQEAGMGIKDQ